MKRTSSIPFIVALAIASPAAAQVIEGVPGGVAGGVPQLDRPVIAPLRSDGAHDDRARPDRSGPDGLGPMGPGPMGPGPIGPGSDGAGSDRAGSDGHGPDRIAGRGDEQDRERERQDREREQKERERPSGQSAERDRESSLYEQGNNALYESRWDSAVNYFSRLADLKGTRADSALYWKSYAQNRLGQRADALSTISRADQELSEQPLHQGGQGPRGRGAGSGRAADASRARRPTRRCRSSP